MRKSIAKKGGLFPMPVLIISTYNEDKTIDCMNAAWGTMEDMDVILIELTKDHKTCKNIEREKAFTVGLCDKNNVVSGDYVGIVSNNQVKDKFLKTNWHAIKAESVNAPTIDNLPISLECELLRIDERFNDYVVYGKIKNVTVKEECLDNEGKLSLDLCQLISYCSIDNSYRVLQEKAGSAFKDGLKLK